VKIIINIRK